MKYWILVGAMTLLLAALALSYKGRHPVLLTEPQAEAAAVEALRNFCMQRIHRQCVGFVLAGARRYSQGWSVEYRDVDTGQEFIDFLVHDDGRVETSLSFENSAKIR